jgi:hypothetical protein
MLADVASSLRRGTTRPRQKFTEVRLDSLAANLCPGIGFARDLSE